MSVVLGVVRSLCSGSAAFVFVVVSVCIVAVQT